MKFNRAPWLMFGMALALVATAAEPAPERPPIREFPIETLAQLGREIYRHDQLAWVATDVLMAKHSVQDLQQDGARGWVVDTTDAKAPFVRFCRERGGQLEAAYDIVFQDGKKPKLVTPKDRKMTKLQLTHLEARDVAWKALAEGEKPWCGGNPNFVVLGDPDGGGYLVYILRAKPAMDQVPIGGHYRITVAADGHEVERVDQLFASCLAMSRNDPEGHETVGLTVGHVVSNTPLETHVFLSLQEKMPFYISTMDAKVWKVENGQIGLLGEIEPIK